MPVKSKTVLAGKYDLDMILPKLKRLLGVIDFETPTVFLQVIKYWIFFLQRIISRITTANYESIIILLCAKINCEILMNEAKKNSK